MLDFRKVLLAFSVAGLLVGTASAQTGVLTAITNPSFEGSVAIEGTTELVPLVTVTCNNAGAQANTGCTTVGGGFSLTLTSNVPITNEALPAPNPSGKIDVSATDGCANPVAGDTATVTLPGASTILISFSAPSCSVNTITVKGIRVNPSGSPLLSQVSLTLGSTSLPVSASPATLNVAFVQKTFSSVVIASNNPVVPPNPAVNPVPATSNLSACAVLPTELYGVAAAVLTNGFPDSLHTATEIQGPVSPLGFALQGTTIAVTFTNLNPGVNYYVPLAAATTGGLTMSAYTTAAATTAATTVASGPATGLVLLTQTSGSATVYYSVTADAAAGTETATINLSEVIPSVAGVTSYSSSPVAVSVTLVSSGSNYPGYSSSQTPYAATEAAGGAGGNGLLTPCTTTLLFPYVINVAGFDTGLAISNASTGVAGISPASGGCNVTFYGSGTPTPNPYPTGTITTGTVTPFDVGTVAPGFSGYAVAVCNFQGAHGYAFVSDGLGTGTGIASNYLAVVLSDNLASAAGTTAF